MMPLLLLACSGSPDETETTEVEATQEAPQPGNQGPGGPGGPNARGKGPPRGKAGKVGPNGGPMGPPGGPGGQGGPGGPPGGPGGGGPDGGPGGSGAQLQDPSGFPAFHDWTPPEGPAVSGTGDFSEPERLTAEPGGGYRPQIAVAPDGLVHVVYYERADAGDLIRHRTAMDGKDWSAPASVGHDSDRNWGPDIVARDDGSLVMVYDHALETFSSTGFFTTWSGGSWSDPVALTETSPELEIGSGHVAHGTGDELAYVWIGKKMDPSEHFQARWRWYRNGEWGEVQAFSDGTQDAWHTNVERRPDGSMLAGYDIGAGGMATTLYVVDGRDGSFGEPEDITANGEPGERPHFAFGEALGDDTGPDHITWFHKDGGSPKHVYTRSGSPGSWGPVREPSKGYGGFHFDPEIAINGDGVRVLVWGWDSGDDAEMIYSVDRGEGWTKPVKLAEIDWGKPGLASIDVDPQGDFHVAWNQGVRGENHVYHAVLANPAAR